MTVEEQLSLLEDLEKALDAAGPNAESAFLGRFINEMKCQPGEPTR